MLGEGAADRTVDDWVARPDRFKTTAATMILVGFLWQIILIIGNGYST